MIMILLLLLLFSAIGYLIGKYYKHQLAKFGTYKKYHLHHDLIGLALILLSFFLRPASIGVSLTGIGLGLFIHHTLTEGIKLISKK